MFAIEKNPNAFVTYVSFLSVLFPYMKLNIRGVVVVSLQHRQDKEWGTKVDLIFGDMRSLDVPEEADILVSELLGSFGDNELSPECLDGAMRFLKREYPELDMRYCETLTESNHLYYLQPMVSRFPRPIPPIWHRCRLLNSTMKPVRVRTKRALKRPTWSCFRTSISSAAQRRQLTVDAVPRSKNVGNLNIREPTWSSMREVSLM